MINTDVARKLQRAESKQALALCLYFAITLTSLTLVFRNFGTFILTWQTIAKMNVLVYSNNLIKLYSTIFTRRCT